MLVTNHYNDIIMSAMASEITSLTIVYSTVYSGTDKKTIKTPRHWALCVCVCVGGGGGGGGGEFTGDRWIPRKMASNAEHFSIWWRHHDDQGIACEIAPNWLSLEFIHWFR